MPSQITGLTVNISPDGYPENLIAIIRKANRVLQERRADPLLRALIREADRLLREQPDRAYNPEIVAFVDEAFRLAEADRLPQQVPEAERMIWEAVREANCRLQQPCRGSGHQPPVEPLPAQIMPAVSFREDLRVAYNAWVMQRIAVGDVPGRPDDRDWADRHRITQARVAELRAADLTPELHKKGRRRKKK